MSVKECMHSQSLVGTKVRAVVMRKMTSIPIRENRSLIFKDTLRSGGVKGRRGEGMQRRRRRERKWRRKGREKGRGAGEGQWRGWCGMIREMEDNETQAELKPCERKRP